MSDESYEDKKYTRYIAERDKLTDAARESSRTFDQAVLAFGAAVFGASVAFVKDVAPKPQSYSLPWLCIAWVCFAVGLLAATLSFLFSHKTCIARIEDCDAIYKDREAKLPKDVWGIRTSRANYTCVWFLFAGILAWVVFAVENVAKLGGK